MPKSTAKLNQIVQGMGSIPGIQSLENEIQGSHDSRPNTNPAPVTQEQADIRDKQESGLGETLGAAFRENNLTVNIPNILFRNNTIDPNYDSASSLKELQKDIPEEYWKDFTGYSREADEQTYREIKQRMHDKEVLQNSHGLTWLGAEAASMILDPVGVGMFGAEEKLLAGATKASSRIAEALYHAGATAGTMAVYGETLRSAHHDKTDIKDVFYDLAGGAVFGAALGGLSKGAKELTDAGIDASKNLQKGLNDELIQGVKHEPMTVEEATARATEEYDAQAHDIALRKLQEKYSNTGLQAKDAIPDTLKDEHAALVESLREHSIQKRTEEILAANKKLVETHPKPVAEPPLDIADPTIPDAFNPFQKMRQAISNAFENAAKNDGSTLGMGPVIDTEAVQATERLTAKQAYEKEADDLVKSGVFKNLGSKVSTVATKFGITDSTFMYGMKSNMSKLFSHKYLESPAGLAERTSSAAIKKVRMMESLKSEFMPELYEYISKYKKEHNIPWWNMRGDWIEDMNKELRIEMESRTNAHNLGIPHVSPSRLVVGEMADVLDRAMGKAVDLLQKTGVYDAENLIKRSGYVPLLWRGRMLRNIDPELEKAYQKALSESYVSVTGMSEKDADMISKAVLLRAKRKDLGIDSNPHNLLSQDSREFLRSTLENMDNGPSQHDIDSLFSRIDANMADSGASARVKRRTNVDLLKTFEHNGKQYQLLDLVENDLPSIYNRYVGEVSGRAALAAKGISSEADWTQLREILIEAAAKAGDSPQDIERMKKVIAATYDQMLSRPAYGGIDHNARRLMDMAQLAILNQAGIPQIAEFAPIIASHGIHNMWRVLPALREFRQSLKNGTISETVLHDIMPWYGRIGQEHMLYRPDIRLDDKLRGDADWLMRLDRITARAKDLSGWVSGMYSIRNMQQQMTVMLQANKVAQALKELTIDAAGNLHYKGKAANLERLKDVGWDEAFLKELKSKEHLFEFEDGVIQRLHIDQWNNGPLQEQFIEGLHRHTAQIIQKPFIGETHYFMNGTLGAMLTQFRNYPIVAIEKQMARHARIADEEAFYTTLVSLGMSSLVYAGKVGINSLGKSDKERQKYLDDRLSTSGMLKGALMYSNVTAVTQDMINVLGGIGLAPSSLISTQVSRSGGARGLDPSLKDIPSIGYAVNATNAIGGLIKNTLNPDYKYGKKDVAALRGATLFGNHYVMTPVFNALDAEVEDN